MGTVRKAIVWAFIAVIIYFLVRPTTVVLQYSIFIARDPKFVYQHLGDLRVTAKNHPYVEYIKLMNSTVNTEGMQEHTYECKDNIPIWGSWTFPVRMGATVTMTKPGKELIIYYYIWYAMLEGHILRTVKPKINDEEVGAEVNQKYSLTTPWITSLFIMERANPAHKDSLWLLKQALEGITS